MAFSSKQENDYDSQLKQIAAEVDSYVVKTDGALEYFRKQIRPLAQRWKTYHEAVDKRKKELLDHWEKVKKNPTLQDKNIKQSGKWEWDKFYLSNLPIGPDDKIQNPEYYMSAKLTSIYLKNLKGYIDRNKEKLKTLLFSSGECKRLQDTIADQEHQYNEVETQYNKLTNEQQENDRFFVGVRWYRYVYSLEEESEKVFGCWRPPLTPLPEHPLKILKPVESRYQRNQTRKELSDARNTQEEYERYYIFLSSVHDNYLQGVEKITEGIWSDNLSIAVLCCLDKGHGDKTAFLKAALERVCQSNHKADKKKEQKKGGWGKKIGVGLFCFAAIATILVFLFGDNIWGRISKEFKSNKPAAKQSETAKIENNVTTETKTSGDSSPESKTKQIAENKLRVTLKEICNDIDSRPLAQQNETAMRYVGVPLKEQELELFDVYSEDDKFGLSMIIPGQPDVTFLRGIRIYFSVDKNQYPELNAATKGVKFYVTGKIKEADRFIIKLSDVSLKFD